MSHPIPIRIAIVGAGPVGLSLALLAARTLPAAQITLFDARSAEADTAADPRTLALSLGSVQLLQRLGAWQPAAAQPIVEVHVSQQPPSFTGPVFGAIGGAIGGLISRGTGGRPGSWLTGAAGEPAVRIRAVDEGVPLLGAVLGYGAIVSPLQRAWQAACDDDAARLCARFGTPVASLKPVGGGAAGGQVPAVEVDAGIVEPFDLVVVAEGSVFKSGPSDTSMPRPLRRDYRQTAWVGSLSLRGGRPGVAYERFTRHGPAALLPLAGDRAALVWCVDGRDDPVRDLSDAQRLAVLANLFPREAGQPVALSALKPFDLGLLAARSLIDGRTVRIGNAAQTLHPVAGQGLNLGLRDAFELVQILAGSGLGGVNGGVERGGTDVGMDAALRRFERRRAPDRWALIAATDFLARSFTWQLPGAASARGVGLAALQAIAPLKSALTRQMMYGRR